MHPKIGLRDGDARWLPIASLFNGNISGPLPLPSLAFKLDLLNFLALKNFPQTALVQQCLIKLQVELLVAIKADFWYALRVRSIGARSISSGVGRASRL